MLIAGAGPAGTACGIELRRKNWDCLLVDPAKFPRDKLCGGGLTPKAQKVLADMLPDMVYDYLPIRRMTLYMDGDYRGSYALRNKEIRVVQRKEFDAQLLYNSFSLWLVRLISRHQNLTERILNRHMY